MQKSYYAIIPADVRYDKKLPANAKLLYGELTALSNEKGYCWANNEYFAELYDLSKSTISRLITKLEKNGYIKVVVKNEKNGFTRKIYIKESVKKDNDPGKKEDKQVKKAYKSGEKDGTPLRKNKQTPMQKCVDPLRKNAHTPTQKCVHNNTTNTTINNTNNKKTSQLALRLTRQLKKSIGNAIPDNRTTNKQAWESRTSRNIDLMLRIDKRPPDLIAQVIDYLNKDQFWWKVILSGEKLRAQFDKVLVKMREYNKRHNISNYDNQNFDDWNQVKQKMAKKRGGA